MSVLIQMKRRLVDIVHVKCVIVMRKLTVMIMVVIVKHVRQGKNHCVPVQEVVSV